MESLICVSSCADMLPGTDRRRQRQGGLREGRPQVRKCAWLNEAGAGTGAGVSRLVLVLMLIVNVGWYRCRCVCPSPGVENQKGMQAVNRQCWGSEKKKKREKGVYRIVSYRTPYASKPRPFTEADLGGKGEGE